MVGDWAPKSLSLSPFALLVAIVFADRGPLVFADREPPMFADRGPGKRSAMEARIPDARREGWERPLGAGRR